MKIHCISLYGTPTNEINFYLTVLHMSFTRLINLNCGNYDVRQFNVTIRETIVWLCVCQVAAVSYGVQYQQSFGKKLKQSLIAVKLIGELKKVIYNIFD